MHNLTMRVRFALTFALVLGFMLVISLVGVSKINAIERNLETIVNENEVRIELASQMRNAMQASSTLVRDIALSRESSAMAAEFLQLQQARAAYDALSEKLAPHVVTDEGKALFANIQQARDAARASHDQVIQLSKSRLSDEATRVLLTQARPQVSQWGQSLERFAHLQHTRNQARMREAREESALAKLEIYTVGVLAVLLSLGLAAVLSRSIAGPIHDCIQVMARIAHGDLTTPIDTTRKDELGQLLCALQSMQSQLTTVVADVHAISHAVSRESSEIAAGNKALSDRTVNQASALEQTAAAMEDFNAAVHRNAAGAEEANLVAQKASTVANAGGDVVAKVVDTMQGINASSQKIGDIVSLIDSIAFQTNILALNASVEAARAGTQGKGFAVVATEVRSLAARSAQAAKEIKSLIAVSMERVELGADLANQAGHTMGEVLDSINLVAAYVARISAESAEQSTAVTQIKEAINQLDGVTQKNAAMVEEMSGTAHHLSGESSRLMRSVSVFKINALSA